MTPIFTRWTKIFRYAMAFVAHPLGTPVRTGRCKWERQCQWHGNNDHYSFTARLSVYPLQIPMWKPLNSRRRQGHGAPLAGARNAPDKMPSSTWYSRSLMFPTTPNGLIRNQESLGRSVVRSLIRAPHNTDDTGIEWFWSEQMSDKRAAVMLILSRKCWCSKRTTFSGLIFITVPCRDGGSHSTWNAVLFIQSYHACHKDILYCNIIFSD